MRRATNGHSDARQVFDLPARRTQDSAVCDRKLGRRPVRRRIRRRQVGDLPRIGVAEPVPKSLDLASTSSFDECAAAVCES